MSLFQNQNGFWCKSSLTVDFVWNVAVENQNRFGSAACQSAGCTTGCDVECIEKWDPRISKSVHLFLHVASQTAERANGKFVALGSRNPHSPPPTEAQTRGTT